MSIALDRFPADILSAISSYWSFEELRTVLSLCPGSPLAQRLRNGGVTHVAVPSSYVLKCPPLLATLKGLLSVVLRFLDDDIVRQLGVILSLPSGLLHLRVHSTRAHHLMASEEFETDSSLGSATFAGYAPWAVSKTFPRLKSLLLIQTNIGYGQSNHNWDLQSKAFQARFLSLLPPSLEDLDLPLEDFNFEQPLSQLLPNLTRLRRTQKLFPTSDSLPVSMLELDLDLAKPKVKRSTFDFIDGEEEEEEDDESTEEITPELESLRFPHNLTKLTVEPCVFFDLRDPPALPTTLTTLNLWAFHHLNFSGIFARLPHSLTSLQITTRTNPSFDATLLGEPQLRPSISLFTIYAQVDEFSPDDEVLLYDFLLGSLPSLRTCTMSFYGGSGLQERHLALLNPERLQNLKAGMTSEVAASAKLLFPRLQSLSCTRPGNAGVGKEFDLTSVPPSTTSLHLVNFPLQMRDLAKLPPNVTSLHGEVHVSIHDVDFLRDHCVHNKPSSGKSAATESSKMAVDRKELQRLDVSPYDLQRVNKADGSSSLLVVPAPAFAGDRPLHNYHSMKIHFSQPLFVPNTLTDLRITQEDIAITHTQLNSNSLPNLRKLVLRSSLPKTVDLGTFMSLESLHVGAILQSCISGCPPNLTSLKARNELELPANFVPLPSSIRKIYSGMSASPVDRLFPKDCHLEAFVTYGHNNYSRMPYIISQLPSTLKRIGFTFAHIHNKIPEWHMSLGQHFPTLEEIHLKDSSFVNVSYLNILHSTGAKIIGGTLSSCEPLTQLIELAGGLDIRPDEELSASVVRAAIKAFPNTKMKFDCKRNINFAAAWSSVVIYMPPALVELDLSRNYEKMSGDMLALVPRGLKRLRCPELTNFADVRKSLSELSQLEELSVKIPNIQAADIASFPRALKRLTIDQHLQGGFTLEHALQLPPNLTDLSLSERDIDDEALTALPSSLVRLQCEPFRINPTSAMALPPTLKIYIGYFDRPYTQTLAQFAEQRQMFWLGPRSSRGAEDYGDENGSEDEDDY